MPSVRLPGLGARGPADARSAGLGLTPSATPRAPTALALALLAVGLYAAFAHGAVDPASDARVQLAIAVVAAIAAAEALWKGALRLTAPRIVWSALCLLAAFAIWTAVTLAWSVSPEPTWLECNRAITYMIFIGLAIALGASHASAFNIAALGFLAVCAAVAIFGLGQKLAPGLHVPGVFDLNQTAQLPRLEAPFGYWNALALFVAMGVPIALSLAADGSRAAWMRLGGLVAVALMLQTIAFTYSRGGVLALVCGLAVGVAVSGARLRLLIWLALVAGASGPAIAIGLSSHELTAAGVALGTRELAGLELTAVLAACLLLMVLAGRRLIVVERRSRVSPTRARDVGRGLAGLVAAGLVVALLAVAFSARGLDGTVSRAWASFTATRAASVYDPSRLLSADSENRWVWWKEAAGAFGDRPLGGWGAGSFGTVHLLYRRDTLPVQQPHSVPLQFLAETGIVGALLALGAFGLLLAAAVRAVRAAHTERARLLAGALLAGAVTYAVHELYDWDWDIPGVTLPVLLLLGTLGGSLAPPGRRAPAPAPVPGLRLGPGPGRSVATPKLRALATAAAAIFLAAFAFSVILPRLAAGDASRALIAASNESANGNTNPQRLRPALDSALLASRLDPLSDAGLRAASTISIQLGRLAQARSYLLDAVARDPADVQAWQELAFVDFATGDDREGLAAAQRARALDPEARNAIALAQGALLTLAPPAQSATAIRTP